MLAKEVGKESLPLSTLDACYKLLREKGDLTALTLAKGWPSINAGRIASGVVQTVQGASAGSSLFVRASEGSCIKPLEMLCWAELGAGWPRSL